MLASVLFGLFLVPYPIGAEESLNEVLPFVRVDSYAPCLRTRGDSYCFVSATLSGNASHPFYNRLLEHSENKLTHFNRTNVHRGLCLKTSCQNYLNSNVTDVVEACLNATLDRDYGLRARVFRTSCSEYQERVRFDTSDIAFGAVLFVLLMLNLLGSLQDLCGVPENTNVGRLLSCFAIRRNWQNLTAPLSGDPKLQSLSGSKILMSLIVLLAHASIGSYYAFENSHFVEESYNSILMILYSGTEALHLFSIISAVLLVYNILTSEKPVTWQNLHKIVLKRWIRFTPMYALVLFFNATWARHVGEGPFWKTTMEVEANDCRRDWWLHLLYIHNYVDNSRCMVHSWSLALDMQLTAVGSATFLLKSVRARKLAIVLLITVGLLTPAAAIFFKNLHPLLVISPELLLNWIVHDPTFNNLYKRGHTNLVSYGLGLLLGYVIYNMKDSDLRSRKYKKYRTLHYLVIPIIIALQLPGIMFYDPAPAPLHLRMLYSSASKLVTGLLLCSHVFLNVVKANKLASAPFWWRCWTPLARLTFCEYLLHMSIIRIRAGALEATYHVSGYTVLQRFVETTVASFLLAIPLFLLVEAPFSNLVRLKLAPRHEKKHYD